MKKIIQKMTRFMLLYKAARVTMVQLFVTVMILSCITPFLLMTNQKIDTLENEAVNAGYSQRTEIKMQDITPISDNTYYLVTTETDSFVMPADVKNSDLLKVNARLVIFYENYTGIGTSHSLDVYAVIKSNHWLYMLWLVACGVVIIAITVNTIVLTVVEIKDRAVLTRKSQITNPSR